MSMSMRYGAVDLCVPPGFQNILRLISHEVLRIKPENTMQFIARFLDDLLDIREASGYDPVTQGDMIDRVQEHYWKLQRMRRESEAKIIDDPDGTEDSAADPCEGSGDTGAPTSIEGDAEAVVTYAIHEETEERMQQEDTDQPIDVTEEEMVAKQPEPREEEQSVDTTISDEGQDKEGTTEEVTIATEEHLNDAGREDDPE